MLDICTRGHAPWTHFSAPDKNVDTLVTGGRDVATYQIWSAVGNYLHAGHRENFEKVVDTHTLVCDTTYMNQLTYDLTPSQEEFVRGYLICGNAVDAYVAAFDTNNRASAQSNASKLLTKPKIKARIKELSDDRITGFVPAALKTLTDTATNPTHKDASASAKHLLALAGYQPHQIIEVHKINTADKIKAVTAMVSTLAGLGMTIDLSSLVPAALLSLAPPSRTPDDDDMEFVGA